MLFMPQNLYALCLTWRFDLAAEHGAFLLADIEVIGLTEQFGFVYEQFNNKAKGTTSEKDPNIITTLLLLTPHKIIVFRTIL